MYNKLSPFISLGLRRFPPSALQQVLVWRGSSDGISAGCVVGINDLLKAICPPKVTRMHARARVSQPYVHPDSSHNDRTNYNILCGLGVCECVSVLFEAVSLLVMERDSFFCASSARAQVECECVCGRAEKTPMKRFESVPLHHM